MNQPAQPIIHLYVRDRAITARTEACPCATPVESQFFEVLDSGDGTEPWACLQVFACVDRDGNRLHSPAMVRLLCPAVELCVWVWSADDADWLHRKLGVRRGVIAEALYVAAAMLSSDQRPS